MKTYSKKELKEIIKEVIQERWSDIFKLPEPAEYSLFNNIDKWIDEMLDDAGNYVGPDLGYLFEKGKHIQLIDYISYSTLETIEKWNILYGRKYNLSSRDVTTANKMLRHDLFTNHPEAIIGTFQKQ